MSGQAYRIAVVATTVIAGVGVSAAALSIAVAGRADGATTTCATAQSVTGNATGLLITPPTASMAPGECDTFTNHANAAVTVTVSQTGTAYREVINAGASVSYTTSELGKHTITATELFASAPGKLTVVAATPTPTASSSSPVSTPSTSASAPASASASASSSRRRRRKHHNGATTVPSLTIPPGETSSPYSIQKSADGVSPLVAGSPAPSPSLMPSPGTTLTPSAELGSGLISPPSVSSGGSHDLLLAVAAMLAFGQFLAFGRVLLAVDKRRRDVGPRS